MRAINPLTNRVKKEIEILALAWQIEPLFFGRYRFFFMRINIARRWECSSVFFIFSKSKYLLDC